MLERQFSLDNIVTDKKEASHKLINGDHGGEAGDLRTAPSANPIDWFRQASPYIKSYRNTTLVLHIDGELLDSPLKAVMAHDITLLSHLGVRLVLVPGLRSRINRHLKTAGIESPVIDTQRVTSADVLATIRTCLLYTSPSPRDATLSRMPSSA